MYLKGRWAGAFPIAFVLVLGTAAVLPVQAKLSAAQISKIVDDSKILGSDKDVRAELHESDKEALVFATRNPKATDKDCKIDAVLIAKNIIDADPVSITKIKVTFFDQSDKSNYRQITVREGDVKAFAARVISQETLLDEIELIVGHGGPSLPGMGSTLKLTAQAPEVVAGIYHDERVALLGQIQSLQAKGVGVGPFLTQFSQIEEKVKQGDEAGVTKSLRFLNDALSQQSQQLRKIQEQKRLQESERLSKEQEKKREREDKASERAQKLSADQHEQYEREEHEERLERARKYLGDLAPVEGSSWRRRWRVASRIKQFRDAGKDVSPLMPIWREIEKYAANKDKAHMNPFLEQLEQALGVGRD